jgi:hypothetical protein
LNETYTVEVAARVGSTWTEYGSSCDITMQESKLNATDCDNPTPRDANYLLTATNPTGSQRWRFKVSGGNLGSPVILESGTNQLRISDIPGVTFNETYNTEVEVRVDGVWRSYGAICTFTTVSNTFTLDLNGESDEALINNDTNGVLEEQQAQKERDQVKRNPILGEKSTNHVMIYPNPVMDVLNIRQVNEGASIQSIRLLNTKGHIVLEHRQFKNAHKTIEEIDVTHLPKGMYVIQISTDSGIVHKKVIVQ